MQIRNPISPTLSQEVDSTRKIIVKNLTDEKSRGPSSARVLVCTIEKVMDLRLLFFFNFFLKARFTAHASNLAPSFTTSQANLLLNDLLLTPEPTQPPLVTIVVDEAHMLDTKVRSLSLVK